MTQLQERDLVQILPAAARLEAVGGSVAARIRAGIVDLLGETCDVAALRGARMRLLQQVGADEALHEAETRLVEDAIHSAMMRLSPAPASASAPSPAPSNSSVSVA